MRAAAVLGVLAAAIATAAAAWSVARTGWMNRDALREIVRDRCVADWVRRHDPAPCAQVVLPGADDEAQGYALLADRKGGAHFLLIPTRIISGIESPQLLQPGTPNYFADAWRARTLVETTIGHIVRRDDIGLAVNSRYSRSQNQLHIHIECLRARVHAALQSAVGRIGDGWTPLDIDGWRYQALRVRGAQLGGANPFVLLAHDLPHARHAMGAYTLVVAGMRLDSGPGFILLAGRAVPGGESLLDATCAIAQPPHSDPASENLRRP